jgi:60 kDa SS-A/Ro ribonucleoprotein
MRCIDVAALFAAAILRRNPDSDVIPFDTSAYDAKIDPNDSILSIAERLRSIVNSSISRIAVAR